MNISSPM